MDRYILGANMKKGKPRRGWL